MKLNDFINVMDGIAPRELAMDWDNPGLLIGTEKQDIKKVLVALDCSMATAKEAVEWGADLMLTHHPVFFRAVKRILPDDPETAAPYILLRNGIGLFAAHTNLDAADGGVNDCLAGVFSLENGKTSSGRSGPHRNTAKGYDIRRACETFRKGAQYPCPHNRGCKRQNTPSGHDRRRRRRRAFRCKICRCGRLYNRRNEAPSGHPGGVHRAQRHRGWTLRNGPHSAAQAY